MSHKLETRNGLFGAIWEQRAFCGGRWQQEKSVVRVGGKATCGSAWGIRLRVVHVRLLSCAPPFKKSNLT